MATPSSKNNPGATPTQFTSSPHPSGVPMGRPVSHKSPSMRTPSMSGYGSHHPHLSASSHQYTTPAGATAPADDTAMFSSPSALLALGLSGITPSPAGHDNIVGQGMNENEMQSMGMSSLGIGGPRDLDEEKRRRLNEVTTLLRTRVAGRGVCREGVERLGSLEGFECMWQDNNLSIAGNSVDLEIEFENDSEYVKDVSLRYATPDAPEGDIRVEASSILKHDLMQTATENSEGFWKKLDGFHTNLEQLAKMDKLSRDINCFQAVEGLYESFKLIWDSENQRVQGKGPWERACSGIVGKPGLHQRQRVGLTLEYWVDQGLLRDLEQRSKGESTLSKDSVSEPDSPKLWGLTIECEEGYPSLRISKQWVAPDVFTSIENSNPLETAGNNPGALINWTDPPQTLVSSTANNSNSMAIDSTMIESTPPNRRFVAKLEPPIDLTAVAAAEVYRLLGVEMPQDFRLNMFDGLVLATHSSTPDDDPGDFGQLTASGRKNERSMYSFDDNDQPVKHQHKYTFHPVEQVAGRTVRELPFSHPRQIADVLPVSIYYRNLL